MTTEEIRREIKTAASIIDSGTMTRKKLLMIGTGLLTAMMHFEGSEDDQDKLWKEVTIVMDIAKYSIPQKHTKKNRKHQK